MTDSNGRAVRVPPGLGVGGTRLWRETQKLRTGADGFNPAELAILEEACRQKDRLDRLNALLVGDVDTWAELRNLPQSETTFVLVVNDAMTEARQLANVFKMLVTALRLPDEATGSRPQHRGARGSYKPGTTPSRAAARLPAGVTAIDRAARAAQGV